MRHAVLASMMSLAIGTSVAGEPLRRTLTVADRVEAQRAIEQVYWNHRIWPKDNPGPKPALSAVMSEEVIRAKVEDYVKKSNALDMFWKRPITAMQLQVEMDRMAANTRDGGVLGELFAALGNDPFVIAETLARQTLVDRLIRDWYANDIRFHGALKKRAQAALRSCTNAGCSNAMGGEYYERTWRLRAEATQRASGLVRGALGLDADQWQDNLDRIAARFDVPAESIPLRRWSRLDETVEGFVVTAVLSRSEDEITSATMYWPKHPFEAWWSVERTLLLTRVEEPPGPLALPGVALTSCTNDTWMSTQTGPSAPGARQYHTAIWTGAEMIVWGGYRYDTAEHDLNTGGRYNPATDSWSATSMGPDVPQGRLTQTAIWTGTEMIVWGGSYNIDTGATALDTGGRYDPSMDSWKATSTGPNVPAARDVHTAVWTGTEMIVWGGCYYDADVHSLNTGGRYDPAGDSWTATSIGANVPSARFGFTAVWTGAEMVVWGGLNNDAGDTYYNSGGRYSPSTDLWTATSTGQNVPTRRYFHTAVWTGSEMIVWGGYYFEVGKFFLNTGGRYDPSTDSWTATSIGANVPAARWSPTAVWTGTQMIVWGGESRGTTRSLYNSGGRYDPSTDGWTMTSVGANVPTPRTVHTAVWTGTKMIVWGGYDGISFGLNTGAQYCVSDIVLIVYRDADGDGYGNAAIPLPLHDGSIPAGYVVDATDCDDANPIVHPNAVEICDGIDDNCNGVIDENASGVDSDGDGVRNVCDNCFLDHNPNQSDFDDDGVGDTCDLNDGLIYIRGTADPSYIGWQQEQGPTSWNLYAGDLNALRATGVYAQAPGSNPLADRQCGLTELWGTNWVIPAEGAVEFLLVTGVAGGVESNLGVNSAGVPRANANPCP